MELQATTRGTGGARYGTLAGAQSEFQNPGRTFYQYSDSGRIEES